MIIYIFMLQTVELQTMSRDSKGSVKISTGAVVCNESELKGDITIGARTVIHPKAKIIAESGPIIIGNLGASQLSL